MSKYKLPRKSWYKSKKFNNKCAGCGKEIPDNLAFSYVDESNAAITKNSPYYCWKCYNEKYPNDLIGISYLLRCAKIQFEIIGTTLHIEDKSYELRGLKIDDIAKEYNL